MTTIIAKPKPHTLRRFESLPVPSPADVAALPASHDAMIAKGPLFRDMVFPASEVPSIFVSGHNNRKIGRVVMKGAWAGMPIYMLTLPERTTCPEACHMWASCYGNAMHLAKRIAPGAALEARIVKDIAFLADKHPKGFVIRLHVLGDFYSVAYVRLWADLLAKHSALHIYGYTARGMTDETDRRIFDEIGNTKIEYPSRFRIRWSRPEASLPFPHAAVVLDKPKTKPEGGIVCPAETEATACCATCGMCWEEGAADKTIYFLKHGLGSSHSAGKAQEINEEVTDGYRTIKPVEHLRALANTPKGKPPQLLWVNPLSIRVEVAYQRDLSKSSIEMIRDIVQHWDWRVFTPPCCVKIDGVYYAYDGQHTAIAAATHPQVDLIPILVTEADTLEDRAGLFVKKNWGRITPTQLQKFKALAVGGHPETMMAVRAAKTAGVTILPNPPSSGGFKIGDTLAIGAIRWLIRRYGEDGAAQTMQLLVEAEQAPLRADVMKAVGDLLYAEGYRGRLEHKAIARAVMAHPYESSINGVRETARENKMPVPKVLATLYFGEAVRE